MHIPFNKPYMTGRELYYISMAHANGHLAGNGEFTRKCEKWIEDNTGTQKSLLTHSCTAALEMAALLLDLQSGDEVIMPSFTFVSTANAFVLRGAVPVFVDIRYDTKNIDETKIEAAITPKTKAIIVVHYAGVSCEMNAIMKIANKHNLIVIEDAAHGIMSTYDKHPLGSIGHLATFSFHETKNIISGEGGAILINDKRFVERAEIIREKGTNRTLFFRGQVDKYTWVDIGSSYLPSELIAAFLLAQMEDAKIITDRRLDIWNRYHSAMKYFEEIGLLERPNIPEGCEHNAHMYYLILKNLEQRTNFINFMKQQDIHPVFHYVPLHSSPCGLRYCRVVGQLKMTDDISERIVRLPLWLGLEPYQDKIINVINNFFS